jgi:hypothetical protein
MIEKIDIIDTQVYCYNDKCELIKTLELSQFVEYPYDDMTPEQKLEFDSFVEQANTL